MEEAKNIPNSFKRLFLMNHPRITHILETLQLNNEQIRFERLFFSFEVLNR